MSIWMISMCMIYGRNDNNNNKDVDTHSKHYLTRGLQGASLIISPTQSVSNFIIKKFSILFNRKPWSYGSFNGIRVRWNSHHKLAAKDLHITMITAFPHNPKLEATNNRLFPATFVLLPRFVLIFGDLKTGYRIREATSSLEWVAKY